MNTAIVAQQLNPQIRIVMRSSRQHLNQLLKQQFGNFAAFEPTDLPAPSFALAGLQAGILGVFNIDRISRWLKMWGNICFRRMNDSSTKAIVWLYRLP